MKRMVYSFDSLLRFRKRRIIIFAVLVVLLGLVLGYFLTHYHRCNDFECFKGNLAECKKTKFAGGDNIIYGYVIDGKKDGKCVVNVELLEGSLTNQDTSVLKGKSMVCYLDYGVVSLPESDLSKCHGELKEALQEQVINKLYTYLVQNLGQINRNLIDPLSVINE